jgi:hypothetical protein
MNSGGSVARAKRTDRADARRRYRATQSEAQELDGAEEDEPASTPAASSTPRSETRRAGPVRSGPARPTGSGARTQVAPPQRPSFTGAFRAAARPFDIRSDIAYIPTLVLRTRAVWIPALAAIASGALFLASQPLGSNGLANLAFQLFVLPPTIAGSFLAGILAPRATYIAGGIAALVGALVFSFAVAVTPISLSAATITPTPAPAPSASAAAAPSVDASASPVASAAPSASPVPAPATPNATDADKIGAIAQSILLSVPFGIAIGAFGGYYKRFLYLSNPSRQRRAEEQQRQKSQRQQPGKRRY